MPRNRPGERLSDRLAGRLDGRPERLPDLLESRNAREAAPQPDALDALSQADRPEAVLAASDSARPGDLPAPIRDLVERIRREADRWERATAGRRRAPPPRAKAAGTGARAPASPAPDERMDRLVRRLVHLVHLAEADRHHEAQQRVRMAQDAPAAIQEASPSAGPEAAGSPSPEMGDLGRQVLEAVIRILESRQQRRQEEPDVRDVQW